MRYLQLGDTGRDVEVWQRFLLMQRVLEPHEFRFGEFNDETVEATKTFQTTYNLPITGVCDGATSEAAADRGLSIIEDQIPGAPRTGQWMLIAAAGVLTLLLGTCVLDPPLGKSTAKLQLPLPAKDVPGAAPKKECPGWFC